jgi:hypothetical protein
LGYEVLAIEAREAGCDGLEVPAATVEHYHLANGPGVPVNVLELHSHELPEG